MTWWPTFRSCGPIRAGSLRYLDVLGRFDRLSGHATRTYEPYQ